MRKILAITAMLGLLSGCAWFGSSDESGATGVPAAGSEPIVQGDPQPAPEPTPAPAKKEKANKKRGKSQKGKSDQNLTKGS